MNKECRKFGEKNFGELLVIPHICQSFLPYDTRVLIFQAACVEKI